MLCADTNCNNKKKKWGRYCGACESRIWRKRNPVEAVYNHFKSNAKFRNIPFHVTLKQFKDWTKTDEGSKYMKYRGQGADDLTIDRKKTVSDDGIIMGYTIDNIQVLTAGDNGRKAHLDKLEQWAKKRAFLDPDVPF